MVIWSKGIAIGKDFDRQKRVEGLKENEKQHILEGQIVFINQGVEKCKGKSSFRVVIKKGDCWTFRIPTPEESKQIRLFVNNLKYQKQIGTYKRKQSMQDTQSDNSIQDIKGIDQLTFSPTRRARSKFLPKYFNFHG